MKHAAVMLLLLFPGAALAKPPAKANPGAAPPLASVLRVRLLMGVQCVAQAQGKRDSAATADAIEAAFDQIARLDDMLRFSGDPSELRRLNAAAGRERVTCSADLYDAVDAALHVADLTGGAYDPSIGPLSTAWDLRGEGRRPSADEIARARARVDWHGVVHEPSTRTVRFTREGMALDLDDVARGFALDRIVPLLRSRGIARALIGFGGDQLAISSREPWQVTVPSPRDASSPAIRLALTNAALATVGPPGDGRVVDGVRYGPVLDPRSGATLTTPASVTVVSRSATEARGLAVALLVMGRQRAAAFAAANPGFGVLWLEGMSDGIHAWKWNLDAVSEEPDVSVLWMSNP